MWQNHCMWDIFVHVIGESVKRMSRYIGHNVIGDVHLGDWGLQMGLIITELHERKPELVYFDELMKASIRKSTVYHFRAGGDLPDSKWKNQRRCRL